MSRVCLRRGRRHLLVWVATVLFGLWTVGEALEAFDCQHPAAKHLPLDTTAPPTCREEQDRFLPVKEANLQLLRLRRRRSITASWCKMTVSKKVTRCGMHSHVSGALTTLWEQTEFLKAGQCQHWHSSGEWEYLGQGGGVTLGAPQRINFYSKGYVYADGTCEYSYSFTSGGRTFYYSFEETFLTLTMERVHGEYDPADGIIYFDNKLKGNLSEGRLFDSSEGVMEWSPPPPTQKNPCQDDYDQVFAGAVSLHERIDLRGFEGAVITSREQDRRGRALGLVLASQRHVCQETCHPVTALTGYIACIYDPLRPPPFGYQGPIRPETKEEARQLIVEDERVRANHLYLTSNIEIHEQLREIKRSICQAERRSLYNKLQSVSGGRNPHALLDVYGPGHLLTPAGPAMSWITQCVPVNVTLSSYDNCTEEVPVTRSRDVSDSEEARVEFMEPLTRILYRFPTYVACSSQMPVGWLIGGQWYCSDPVVTECKAKPMQLSQSLLTSVEATIPFESHATRTGMLTAEERELVNLRLEEQHARGAINAKLTLNSFHAQTNGHLGNPLSPEDQVSITDHVLDTILPVGGVLRQMGPYFFILVLLGLIYLFLHVCGSGCCRGWQEARFWGWDGGRAIPRAVDGFFGTARISAEVFVVFMHHLGLSLRDATRRGFGRLFRREHKAIVRGERTRRCDLERGWFGNLGYPGDIRGAPGIPLSPPGSDAGEQPETGPIPDDNEAPKVAPESEDSSTKKSAQKPRPPGPPQPGANPRPAAGAVSASRPRDRGDLGGARRKTEP